MVRRQLTGGCACGALRYRLTGTPLVVHAGSRFVWITDLLPHTLAPVIAGMVEQGLAVIKHTLEQSEARAGAVPT